jgi:hypothetical protein
VRGPDYLGKPFRADQGSASRHDPGQVASAPSLIGIVARCSRRFSQGLTRTPCQRGYRTLLDGIVDLHEHDRDRPSGGLQGCHFPARPAADQSGGAAVALGRLHGCLVGAVYAVSAHQGGERLRRGKHYCRRLGVHLSWIAPTPMRQPMAGAVAIETGRFCRERPGFLRVSGGRRSLGSCSVILRCAGSRPWTVTPYWPPRTFADAAQNRNHAREGFPDPSHCAWHRRNRHHRHG